MYEHCFEEDTKEFVDYYFDKRIRENEVVVNEKDGEIVSAIHLIPKDAVVGNLKTNVTYIYAVATWEKYRKKGYIKEIFHLFSPGSIVKINRYHIQKCCRFNDTCQQG